MISGGILLDIISVTFVPTYTFQGMCQVREKCKVKYYSPLHIEVQIKNDRSSDVNVSFFDDNMQ